MKTKSIERKNAGGAKMVARGGRNGAKDATLIRHSATADRQAAEIARTFSVRWEW
jgi:hypothetical protein